MVCLALLWLCLYGAAQEKEGKLDGQRPNIVYILADDLGYGDLGCLGQDKFATPNIDKLAERGMLFTQHYAGSTVCAPSRSVLMTGQHTGHTPVRGNNKVPLPAESVTLAEILKKNGYVTGAFGKWGLGEVGSEGDPLNQGFDRFYGYNNQSLAHNYYPYHLWDDRQKISLEGNQGRSTGQYAPELIHRKALEFIEENKDGPFFLYYPSILPHAELVAPTAYMNRFKGKFGPEKPYKGVDDGPRYRKGPYASQEHPHAAFVAMVTVLDDQVGEIMAKLDELGIAENTVMVFTSDNGPHQEGGADPGYFNSNGPFKGIKRDLYEGGIHVPMILTWPGRVKAGSTTDHISAFWDVLPTVGELIGATVPDEVDGISFLPTLLGDEGAQRTHDYLYWEFFEKGGRQAVRMGEWKGVKYNVKKDPDAPLELYHLPSDIGENNNVADKHPDIVEKIEGILKEARTPSDIYRFD
ncbi:Arylsulfatase A [Pseudozobellia thermophila]|uniref:Arylsulfatase A n=2 Tax=Pseudozobellia thermophila TaxID=192903 RepID=A0A1M6G9E6_9FLAO|nr:Arylsulfatase A [Pseudozobellia thermophila]